MKMNSFSSFLKVVGGGDGGWRKISCTMKIKIKSFNCHLHLGQTTAQVWEWDTRQHFTVWRAQVY